MLTRSGDPERPKVLIVDDEVRVLESLSDLLRKDFRVLATTDVDEALDVLGRGDVALLLTDQRMPSLTGAELLARAAELCPDTVRILFTAYSDIEGVIQAVNEGRVYHYLSKPWNPERLLELVKGATRQYTLAAENRRLVSQLALLHAETVSAREHASSLEEGRASLERQNQTLREVHQNLESSFWHLKKIQEVLPICMECGQVKSTSTSWEPVVDYLRKSSSFLSHGYCPECFERVKARFFAEVAEGGESSRDV